MVVNATCRPPPEWSFISNAKFQFEFTLINYFYATESCCSIFRTKSGSHSQSVQQVGNGQRFQGNEQSIPRPFLPSGSKEEPDRAQAAFYFESRITRFTVVIRRKFCLSAGLPLLEWEREYASAGPLPGLMDSVKLFKLCKLRGRCERFLLERNALARHAVPLWNDANRLFLDETLHNANTILPLLAALLILPDDGQLIWQPH